MADILNIDGIGDDVLNGGTVTGIDRFMTYDPETDSLDGGAPTVDYDAKYNMPDYYATSADGKTKTLKTDQQYAKEWDEANPEPKAPEAVAAKQAQRPDASGVNKTYSEMLAAYEKMPQEKSDKARRVAKIIAGVGDAITSIASLAGAYNSGVYTAPKQTISDALKTRYEAQDKAQREALKDYITMLQKRMENQARMYNQAAREADTQQRAYNTEAGRVNKANQTAYANAKTARTAAKNDAMNRLGKARAAEQTDERQKKAIDAANKRADKAIAAADRRATRGSTSVTTSQVSDPLSGMPMIDENGNPITKTTTTRTSRM